MRETTVTAAPAIATTSNSETGGPTTGGASSEIIWVRFELLRSALYHDMRQTSLQRIHRLLLFVTILLGSGAIAAFGATWPIVGQLAGVAVAVVSAAQLVWDFGGAARDHADLRRRFYDLLAKAEGGADRDSLRVAMTQIYADEPPEVGRVNNRAHNRAGESLFGDDFIRA